MRPVTDWLSCKNCFHIYKVLNVVASFKLHRVLKDTEVSLPWSVRSFVARWLCNLLTSNIYCFLYNSLQLLLHKLYCFLLVFWSYVWTLHDLRSYYNKIYNFFTFFKIWSTVMLRKFILIWKAYSFVLTLCLVNKHRVILLESLT